MAKGKMLTASKRANVVNLLKMKKSNIQNYQMRSLYTEKVYE